MGAASDLDLDLDGFAPDGSAATEEDACRLVDELVRMGPTFIKLGQLLSTRSDLLPPVYLDALSRLRDDVDPMEPGVAERVVEDELGVRISKAFAGFEPEPIGSASLGQVHRATLRDGRRVAVKVQRPGIRRRALEDMEVIAELAEFLDNHSEKAARLGFGSMVEEFRGSLLGELDYRREADNLKVLGEILADSERIIVPQPVDDYTTSRVLTMDYVDGRSIDSLSPIRRTELDSADLADQLVGAYLQQVLVHGFFHADPHPGNVLLTRDHRLALIDLGMVAKLSPETQEQLLRLLLAISSGDSSDAADALERLGDRLEGYDPDGMRARVADLLLRYGSATVGQLAAGRTLAELAVAASSCGLRPGSGLSMLAKALLNLDQVASKLAPDFDPNEAIRGHVAEVMRHKMLQAASPGNLLSAAMDAKEFAELLPSRVNKVMDALARGELTLNVQGIDEKELMRGIQKLANRVTAGLITAALIIGGAMVMRVDTEVKLFSYSALAVVMLGVAAVAGAWLMITSLRNDVPHDPGARSRRPGSSRRGRG
jgi:predicted unusual protein kinase regulating ubiquinone biosynthesis (AarF/ABC1/UbiB family)